MVDPELLSKVLCFYAFRPPEEHKALDPDKGIDYPRYKLGIDTIDSHVLMGGGYGMTLIAAESGAGKSFLSYGIAARAVTDADPWQVIVWDFENSEKQVRSRLHAGMMGCGETEGWSQRHLARHGGDLHIREGLPGLTLMQVAKWVAYMLDPMRRTLVIIDSINRFAQYLGRETKRDYFRSIEDIYLWAMMVKRMTQGHISFVLMSETNKSGGAKGRWDFAPDLSISITKKGESRRKIVVRKSRDGGDGLDLGAHYFNTKLACFEHIEERLTTPKQAVSSAFSAAPDGKVLELFPERRR
jgi:KaiC/GvpD/RAD55 family RecA-like ATPase